MIHDNQTNTVYISQLLEEKYPQFHEKFLKILKHHDIVPKILRNTKNIWARDYMPVQVSDEKYVQFGYEPEYLKDYEEEKTLPTQVTPRPSDVEDANTIILDGGNLVKGFNKVIIAHKTDSKNLAKADKLRKELKQYLGTVEIIFIPPEPYDYTGHADGLVRFVDDDTVLVSEHTNRQNIGYDRVSKSYADQLYGSLGKTGLDIIQIPSFYTNKRSENYPGDYTALGNYINYLQLGCKVFIPQFYIEEFDFGIDPEIVKECDERAYDKFCWIFGNWNVFKVPSTEIAMDGGVLNCSTWNVKE